MENLNAKVPIIIAMNHPNAFMDPVCITWASYPLRVRYMARGDAFKPGLISFLLDQLGIVPIFRMSDAGKEGMQKNDESYKRVNSLLKRNAKIIIFAEGLCIQERRLRPLKKGVSRMVFGAYEYLNNPNLLVVPIGINYSSPSKFRSKVFYNVGAPIKVSDFIHSFKESPAKTHNQFLQLLQAKMKSLITHIKNKENDTLVPQLEEMVTKAWLQKLNLNDSLENEFTVTNYLTELINNLDELEKEKINSLREKTQSYFHSLQKNNLRDWLIDPLNKKVVSKTNLFGRFILLGLGMPFNLIGYMAGYLPYKLAENITKKIVKGNKEFYASIAFGLGTFIFLINFILWFTVIYLISPTIILPLIITSSFMACTWFSMVFHFFIKKTKGIQRILNNNSLQSDLNEKRQEIMTLINGLTNF